MAIETNELIDVQTLSPFKKFIMTIGNIPTSYLESMSYAELLMWFCNYLQETVIPTVNNNAQAVEELQGLFVELKGYIDNYFENLDVQEEINNKLDAMVEDGTLTDLISSYVDPIYQAYEDEINSTIIGMQSEIASVASGSPAGVYSSVGALTSADPDHTKIYVVSADGKWYYYDAGTSSWTEGGTYQSSVDLDEVAYIEDLVLKTTPQMPFVDETESLALTSGCWKTNHQVYDLSALGDDYNHTAEYPCVEGQEYILTTKASYYYPQYIIFNDQYTAIETYYTKTGESSTDALTITNFKITVPEGGKYIVFNSFKADIFAVKTPSYVKVAPYDIALKHVTIAENQYSHLSQLPINTISPFQRNWFWDDLNAYIPNGWYTCITIAGDNQTSTNTTKTQIIVSSTYNGSALPNADILAYRNITTANTGNWIFIKRILKANKYIAFGDSVCRGNMGNNSKSAYAWPEEFGNYIGYTTTNAAIGGQGWLTTNYAVTALSTIQNTDISGAKLITLSFGINDASDNTVTVGTINDTGNSTVMGMIYSCINYIYSQNPTCQIIITGSTPQNGTRSDKLKEINTKTAQLCEKYGIPFISLDDCPINSFNGESGGSLTTDGTHFNNDGYKLLAQFMVAKLSSISIPVGH